MIHKVQTIINAEYFVFKEIWYQGLFHENTFRHEYNTRYRSDLKINASCLNGQ